MMISVGGSWLEDFWGRIVFVGSFFDEEDLVSRSLLRGSCYENLVMRRIFL